MNIGRGNELRFESRGLSAERDENSEPFLKEQQSQSLISQSAKLKIKRLTQMASNYGDLSRQLELSVRTFFPFFLFLTDNRMEKEGGLQTLTSPSRPTWETRRQRETFRSTPKTKIFPTASVGFKLRPVRRPLPPGEIPARRLSDAAPKARWVDGRSRGDSFGFRMKEEAVTG